MKFLSSLCLPPEAATLFCEKCYDDFFIPIFVHTFKPCSSAWTVASTISYPPNPERTSAALLGRTREPMDFSMCAIPKLGIPTYEAHQEIRVDSSQNVNRRPSLSDCINILVLLLLNFKDFISAWDFSAKILRGHAKFH